MKILLCEYTVCKCTVRVNAIYTTVQYCYFIRFTKVLTYNITPFYNTVISLSLQITP